MTLILIVMIMVIGLWIVGSIYSSINPFIYKLKNVWDYNTAYYAAVMSVERAMLSLRFHDAWFEWKSGTNTWHAADSTFNHWFGKLISWTNAQWEWVITSRSTNTIPTSWEGNIEPLFATWDSSQYNSISYFEWIELPLYMDDSRNTVDFYTTTNTYINLATGAGSLNIRWRLRVPPKIKEWLNDEWLDDTFDVDSDTIRDDVIINRWIKWNDNIEWIFNIIPTIRQNFTLGVPIYEDDNAIRESIINDWDTANNINTTPAVPNTFWFHFAIPWNGASSLINSHNILPLSSSNWSASFQTLLNDPNITWLTLSLNITNRMRTNWWNVYPFLEWKFEACDLGWCTSWIEMPDRFFTIDGYGTVGEYTVRVNIKKPVRETSNASNFTIIF